MTTTARGWTFNVDANIDLVTETCINCGVIFALPSELKKHRLENKQNFYCPNGHSMVYTESEAERLRRQLKQANENERWERQHRETAERSLAATRGVVTKLRRRAHAGVCPFGCRRHFVDLERHVASKHPDQKLEGEEQPAAGTRP